MEFSLERRRRSALARRLGRGAFTIAAAAIGLLWAWNRSLGELLGAPSLQFRHALALALASWLLGAGLRRARQAPGR